MPARTYKFGPYVYDSETWILRKHSYKVKLQPKPAQVLSTLLENVGTPVSRQELQQRLWPRETFVDFEQGLNVAIKKLRDALDDSAERPKYVVTIPGTGYKFVSTVEVTVDTNSADSHSPAESQLTPANIAQSSVPTPLPSSPRRIANYQIFILGLLAVLACVVIALRSTKPQSMPIQPIRATIHIDEKLHVVIRGGALSPDGSIVVFSAADSLGEQKLWMRRLQSLEAEPLQGTEGAQMPFWSPDGSQIGFFTDSALKKVSLANRRVSVLCDVESGVGGSWSRRGEIIFARTRRGPIFKIPESGGAPVTITTLHKERETTHRWPSFLPDGLHFVYLVAHHDELAHPSTLHLASIDGGTDRELIQSDSNAVPVGETLLFVVGHKLLARKLDTRRGTLAPDATIIAEDVDYDPGSWFGNFTATADLIVYSPRTDPPEFRRISWFDRQGKKISDATPPGTYRFTFLQPGGKKIATLCGDPNMSACVINPDGTVTHLGLPSIVQSLTWSRDGKWLAYGVHAGDNRFYVALKRLDGSAPDREVLSSVDAVTPVGWLPDGQHLVITSTQSATTYEIDLLDLHSGRRSRLLDNVPGVAEANISPDGRWVAYEVLESGVEQIYVAKLTSPTAPQRITKDGGVGPHWRADSKALYFLARNDVIQEAMLSAHSSGAIRKPISLFRPPISSKPWNRDSFDVDETGKRFVIAGSPNSTTPDFVLISHWR